MAGVQIDAGELRRLDLELRAANRTLRNAMRRNLKAATLPARQAVQAEELRVLPKRGGLNEWVASAPVGHRMTTPASGAVVRIVQSKKGARKGHDLLDANRTGVIRHPTRKGPGFSQENRTGKDSWQSTEIPTGWFERPLLAMAPAVMVAMEKVMDETARTAGFH